MSDQTQDGLPEQLIEQTPLGGPPQETEKCLIYELGNGQWDIPALRDLLESILPQSTHFDDYEVTHDF